MRRSALRTMIVLSVIVLGVSLVQSAPPENDNIFTGKWMSSTTPVPQVSPMLEGREGYCLAFSGAVVGGIPRDRVYMTHGFTLFGETGDVRSYDFATDTWTALTPSPNPRAEGVGVGHADMVYCLGGRFIGPLALVEVYNPTTDSWTTLSPMATPRAGLAAASLANKIYAIGGRSATGGPCSGAPLPVAEVYDIATDTWSAITPPPVDVSDATAVAHGGKVIVMGGCTFDASGLLTVTDDVQIYDPNTDTWSLGALMPTPRASLASAVMGNTVYAIGGLDFITGNLGVVEAYDIDKDFWPATPITPKTTAASEIQAVRHGKMIFVPGSGSYGLASSVCEGFQRK